MGDIIDCVQKKCQLEPDTDIDDNDDNDKIEPVTDVKDFNGEALIKEDSKELDNQETNKIPQSVNDHYIANSVQDLLVLGEQIKEYDEQ